MSSQKFSALQREALLLAHERKCAYTREPLDVSGFHIDHVIPESVAADPTEFALTKTRLGLPNDFDVYSYENLLPCRPGANLQKGSRLLDPAPTLYFLGIASAKKSLVEAHLAGIEKRNTRGKALILLQQCLESGSLTAPEVAKILEEYTVRPEEIFTLLDVMKFADTTEVRAIAKADIDALRDRPVRMGENDHSDGVELRNDAGSRVYVHTCREYNAAINDGFYAYTTFDMKMATFFEHQCGLLSALQAARPPHVSFIADPKVGIIDLDLMPFSLFPHIGEGEPDVDPMATYQSKVSDGSIVIQRLRQNLLQVVEPKGMGHQLMEVARADFNGDGNEDILLFEYCWATHGTLGFGGVSILTRKSADGLFEPMVAISL